MFSLIAPSVILQYCYQAVNAAAISRGRYAPKEQAFLAEELSKRIVGFLVEHGGKGCPPVMEFTPMDFESYEYMCDILDRLEPTVSIVRFINVRLSIQRFDNKEVTTYDSSTFDGHQGGETKGLGN